MRMKLHSLLATVLLSLVLAASTPAPLRADGPTVTVDGKKVVIDKAVLARPATRPAPTTAPADKDAALAAATASYMEGNYAGAVNAYKKLLDKRSLRVPAAIGLADALAMQGKYADAIKALDDVKEMGQLRADWLVAQAEVLRIVGRYDEALKHAAAGLALKPTWAPAILIHGSLLEMLGRKKEALATYKTMSRTIDGGEYRRDARSLVALGRIMDRYSILSGQRASEQANNILHNYLQEAYQKVDRGYWQAHVAAGMFLLSKHRPTQAAQEFALAMKLNKNIPEVYVGAAAMHLGRWRFEQCMGEVAKALRINPHHGDALYVKAVCLMQWRKYEQVEAAAKAVLKINPNHIEALSLAAAVHVRNREDAKADPYIERVGKINPVCEELPNTIGEWLAAGRQYVKAEKFYRQAIKLAPEKAGPVTNLGKLYMQSGDEDKARTTLLEARRIDDYREDVRNFLSILRDLEKFEVKETEHFIIKVDGEQDGVLLERMANYLESIHAEICSDYEYEPKVKTMIEIFPTHPGFSKRITGKGWIGTIGASTGRVIALVAPNRQRSQFGTFHWPSVLRHEYTHTVTLEATGNRIPHWFTEACAVWQQPDRRNFDAVRRLVGAARAKRLFPIKQLDWGFVRPKRQGDRGLAYAQSEWILEYIISKKGYAVVPKMIKGFRDGKTQTQVFKEILNTTEQEFDKDFRTWAKGEIRKWGFDPAPPPDMTFAATNAKNNPNDAAAQALLALAMLMKHQTGPAEKTARKALKLDANNAMALSVLARILVGKKDYDEAVKVASRLEEVDHTSRVAPKILAQCYLKDQAWALAITFLERLKLRMPMDPYSYTELAKLYMQLGLPGNALPNLIELHRRTMKDATYARQIAEIYGTQIDEGDKALLFWEQVVSINPYETSAYKAMTEIHIIARRYDDAIATAWEMHLADQTSADAWTYVAIAHYRQGKAKKDKAHLTKAKTAAEKAIELDPDVLKAKDVLELVKLALEDL